MVEIPVKRAPKLRVPSGFRLSKEDADYFEMLCRRGEPATMFWQNLAHRYDLNLIGDARVMVIWERVNHTDFICSLTRRKLSDNEIKRGARFTTNDQGLFPEATRAVVGGSPGKANGRSYSVSPSSELADGGGERSRSDEIRAGTASFGKRSPKDAATRRTSR